MTPVVNDSVRVVFALVGLPGSGKTTIAAYLHILSKTYPSLLPRIHLINRDIIRASLFPVCTYSNIEKDASNAAVVLALSANCKMQRYSVLDGQTFVTKKSRERIQDVLKEFPNYRLVFIVASCPKEICIERVHRDVSNGSHIAKNRNVESVNTIALAYEEVEPSPLTLFIDTSKHLENVKKDLCGGLRLLLRDLK